MMENGAGMKRLLVAALAALLVAVPVWSQQVEYYHLDALGSVRAVTDESGNVITRHDYYPYGEEWNEPASNDTRRFTGKERDAETGLDYFGARYYGQGSSRFSSVDPAMTVGQNLVDPQRWNRYSYARTNPLSFKDPDGRNPVTVGVLIGGALLGVLTSPDYAEAPALGDPAYPNNPGQSVGRLMLNTARWTAILKAVTEAFSGAREETNPENIQDSGRAGDRRSFSKDQRDRFWDNSKDAEGTPHCSYCDGELQRESGAPNSFEPDHVKSWKKGGRSTDENGLASCRTCNRSKGSKSLAKDASNPQPGEWVAPKRRH